MAIDYVTLSKEVSYALRHAPWEYELELDAEGFVAVGQLIAAINEGGRYCRPIVREDLEKIIATSDKKRHEIEGDRIRAFYGHSIPGKIAKLRATPPGVLYHGTARKLLESIMEEGLKPMARQYVHLSDDIDTATRVGFRRDESPVILVVDACRACNNGLSFYVGNDNVWLADEVPSEYLSIIKQGN